jgi:hypothetical protein
MLPSIMVTLTRANAQPLPPNQIALKCPLCSEQFHLHYTEDEWHRVNLMLKSANKALREDHKSRHKSNHVNLAWTSG